MAKTILVAGLGNPGKKYDHTRHNVGFFVIEQLQKRLEMPKLTEQKRFKAVISKKGNLLLAKPQTFMNNSGQSINLLMRFYKVAKDNLWIIQDDIDVNLGQFKIQKDRGSAGHKGIESIINSLGHCQFNRIRIGIKPQREQKILTEKFVLQKFSPREEKIIKKIIPLLLDSLIERIGV